MRIVPFLSSKTGLPSNETTYAEMLKEEGYATALIGTYIKLTSFLPLMSLVKPTDKNGLWTSVKPQVIVAAVNCGSNHRP